MVKKAADKFLLKSSGVGGMLATCGAPVAPVFIINKHSLLCPSNCLRKKKKRATRAALCAKPSMCCMSLRLSAAASLSYDRQHMPVLVL